LDAGIFTNLISWSVKLTLKHTQRNEYVAKNYI